MSFGFLSVLTVYVKMGENGVFQCDYLYKNFINQDNPKLDFHRNNTKRKK